LKDKTGNVDAKLWNAQLQDINALQTGLVIKIDGAVLEYKDNLQIKINKYEIVELLEDDIELFVKTAPIEKEVMAKELYEFVEAITNNTWKQIVVTLLKEHQQKFFTSQAAIRHHHNVRSGLLWHTLTMLQTAKAICEVYYDRNINQALLYA
jgi:3'-5' exoribonuclease